MRDTRTSTGRRKTTLSPVPPGKEHRPRAARRRFDRATLGLGLGGVVLGTAGCILGYCLPYRHPVGVAVSVLWWGLYLGCFGAGVGALVGLITKRAPVLPPQGPDDDDVCVGVPAEWLEPVDDDFLGRTLGVRRPPAR
jgi:hypothetical protein